MQKPRAGDNTKAEGGMLGSCSCLLKIQPSSSHCRTECRSTRPDTAAGFLSSISDRLPASHLLDAGVALETELRACLRPPQIVLSSYCRDLYVVVFLKPFQLLLRVPGFLMHVILPRNRGSDGSHRR